MRWHVRIDGSRRMPMRSACMYPIPCTLSQIHPTHKPHPHVCVQVQLSCMHAGVSCTCMMAPLSPQAPEVASLFMPLLHLLTHWSLNFSGSGSLHTGFGLQNKRSLRACDSWVLVMHHFSYSYQHSCHVTLLLAAPRSSYCVKHRLSHTVHAHVHTACNGQ